MSLSFVIQTYHDISRLSTLWPFKWPFIWPFVALYLAICAPCQEYIHRLREDLRTSVREVLHNVPEDHVDPVARAEAVKAVLTAGLFPNLAWLHRYGKGRTIQNLPVKAHPGSVNSKEGHSLVVFYEIQETMDRYLYDSTVIGAAPCLLFAPSLKDCLELSMSFHVVFMLFSPRFGSIFRVWAYWLNMSQWSERSEWSEPPSVTTRGNPAQTTRHF